ncbi:Transcriptional regulatory protein ZraR [subsurface metagenome]
MVSVPRMLVVSSDQRMRKLLASLLREEDYFVSLARDNGEALEKVKEKGFDVVIADSKPPYVSGERIVRGVATLGLCSKVILLSLFSDVESVLRLLQEGAYDYLKKPFVADELKILIRRALRDNGYIEEGEIFKHGLVGQKTRGPLIGKTLKMQKVFAKIQNVAKTDITVLIQGETGTGKELAAEAIHRLSPRKKKSLVRVNCATLSESLVESELFGYEKGAFTGAIQTTDGLFAAAEKGTLFLDEICETNIYTQAKLLQVIEYKEFLRVGGTRRMNVDVRLLIAAKNLKESVEKKKFRQDLYYRLNVFPIFIPPLRERKKDIPLFIHYFLRQHNSFLNKHIRRTSDKALEWLLNYDWPGNVRELENVLLQTVATCKKEIITEDDLPEYFQTQKTLSEESLFSDASFSFKRAKQEVIKSFERKYLKDALQNSQGNISQAARTVKMSRPLFYEKMKKYKLTSLNFKKNTHRCSKKQTVFPFLT